MYLYRQFDQFWAYCIADIFNINKTHTIPTIVGIVIIYFGFLLSVLKTQQFEHFVETKHIVATTRC